MSLLLETESLEPWPMTMTPSSKSPPASATLSQTMSARAGLFPNAGAMRTFTFFPLTSTVPTFPEMPSFPGMSSYVSLPSAM